MGPEHRIEEHLTKSDIFDGDELKYNIWRKRLVNKLKYHGVHYLLEKPFKEEDFVAPEGETTEGKKVREHNLAREMKSDCLAQEIISRRVSEDLENSLLEFTNATQMIDFLDLQYQRKDVQSLGLIKRELYNLKKENFPNLNALFTKFDKLYKDYETILGPQVTLNKIFELIYAVNDRFKAVKDSFRLMNTVQLEALTVQEVKRMFLNAEIQIRSEELDNAELGESNIQAAFVTKSRNIQNRSNQHKFDFRKGTKNRRTCFFCSKRGHYKHECPEYLASKEGEKDNRGRQKFTRERESHANLSEGVPFSMTLDTGATDHMVKDLSVLTDAEKLPEAKKIWTADENNYLLATHKGNLKLKSVVGLKKYKNLEWYDVLFVPNLKRSLISIRQLDDEGKKAVFSGNCCTVYDKSGEILLQGTRISSLYVADNLIILEKKYGLLCESKSELALWHRRLGHIGYSGLQKLIEKNMANGICLTYSKDDVEFCEPCIMGKQNRKPFIICEIPRATRLLEVVHSDLCGPMPVSTHMGEKYFVLFTDGFSHQIVPYLLKTKSEVTERFIQYEKMVTSKFLEKITRFRCDNGGEFSSQRFQDVCKTKGISIEYTVPYTPEQNGVSERMNRTVVEKARTMLTESDLPEFLWGEAVMTACYLVNRSPTSALAENKTPYEIWNGKKPDLSKLKIFGCVAYVHIPSQLRTKFQPKSRKCRFVGYSANGYRLWDPEKRKIIHARDVIFNENALMTDHVVSCKNLRDLAPSNLVDRTEIVDRFPIIPSFLDDPSNIVQGDGNLTNLREINQFESEHESSIESFYDADDEGNQEVEPEERGPIYVVQENGTSRKSLRSKNPPNRLTYNALMTKIDENDDEIPQFIHQLQKRPDWPLWQMAIKEEMQSIEEMGTWDVVDMIPNGFKAVNSKWVFNIKMDNGQQRYKARLVAKGCSQRPGFDFDETFAPVVKLTTIRIFLAIANFKAYIVHQMDVKCAYLNGSLREDIYMKLPPDSAGLVKLVKLNRSLYGLKQSGKCWNDEFTRKVSEMGFKSCLLDPCFYMNKEKQVYMILYVDDILICGPDENMIKNVKLKLSESYKMKDMGHVKKFLNMEISRNLNEKILEISQAEYVSKILRLYGMENSNSVGTPIDPNVNWTENSSPETTQPYRELIGSLQYLAQVSRPDINVAVNILSQYQSRPKELHWNGLKRILRYLNGTKHYKLTYRAENDKPLEGYADANYGGDTYDRKSTSGFCFKAFGDLVSWNTKKQNTISLSSTEAELVALSHSSKEGIWLSNLMEEIGICCKPVTVFEDNQPCICLVNENRISQRIKHIDIKYLFIRDHIKNNNLKVQWISTEDQIADVLTKPLTAISFKKHVRNMKLEGGVVK